MHQTTVLTFSSTRPSSRRGCPFVAPTVRLTVVSVGTMKARREKPTSGSPANSPSPISLRPTHESRMGASPSTTASRTHCARGRRGIEPVSRPDSHVERPDSASSSAIWAPSCPRRPPGPIHKETHRDSDTRSSAAVPGSARSRWRTQEYMPGDTRQSQRLPNVHERVPVRHDDEPTRSLSSWTRRGCSGAPAARNARHTPPGTSRRCP